MPSPKVPLQQGFKLALVLLTLCIAQPITAVAQHQNLGMEGANPIERGRTLFDWVWEPTTKPGMPGRSDGLGPLFNARSCAECHHQGGTGGSGSIDHNIDIITARPEGAQPFQTTFFGAPNSNYQFSYSFRINNGQFEYQMGMGPPGQGGNNANFNRTTNAKSRKNLPRPQQQTITLDPGLLARIHEGLRFSPSVVLHKFSLDPTYREYRRNVAGLHNGIQIDLTQRNTPSLFGLGLVDKIPDETILKQAARQKELGLRGLVARTSDGHVGRFGWKAQKATLREFVEEAAAGELGLETTARHQGADPRGPAEPAPAPDLSNAQIDSLWAFVASLPRPLSESQDEEKVGRRLFKDVGCSACHVQKLGDVDGLYSDLLLHEMKSELRESGSYLVFGVATAAPPQPDRTNQQPGPSHWRTSPLWGIQATAPYLHDGRAATLQQAITEHGGEAEPSARKFNKLSPAQKNHLLQFLQSL